MVYNWQMQHKRDKVQQAKTYVVSNLQKKNPRFAFHLVRLTHCMLGILLCFMPSADIFFKITDQYNGNLQRSTWHSPTSQTVRFKSHTTNPKFTLYLVYFTRGLLGNVFMFYVVWWFVFFKLTDQCDNLQRSK